MPLDAPRNEVCNDLCNAKEAIEQRNADPKRETGPTDAELERGILDAVRLGLADVAKTLATQLDERRRARTPANVVPFRRDR